MKRLKHKVAGGIVVGSRGFSLAPTLLIGSVAEERIHHAPGTVLIVRSGKGVAT